MRIARLRVNGKTSTAVIRGRTAHVSQYVTLERGDLVFTGTPGQTGRIVAGEVCEAEIAGVGILANPVHAG